MLGGKVGGYPSSNGLDGATGLFPDVEEDDDDDDDADDDGLLPRSEYTKQSAIL